MTTLSSLAALYAVDVSSQKWRIMMPTLSSLSLTVLHVVIMKTCNATGNDKVGIVITLYFQLTVCDVVITEWQSWHHDSAFAVPHSSILHLCYVTWFYLCVCVWCPVKLRSMRQNVVCNLHTTTHISTIPYHILYAPIVKKYLYRQSQCSKTWGSKWLALIAQ